MKEFKAINSRELNVNPVQLIGFDWMLITAGKKDSFNTMTAAWGGIGFLWKTPVAYIFVRPQRFTFEFTEKYDHFTLTFMDKNKYRDILNFCGTRSGKEVDKIKETGLTPVETSNGNIYFEEGNQILECRKIYSDYIKEDRFDQPQIPENIYPSKDYHMMYIGEIIDCLIEK